MARSVHNQVKIHHFYNLMALAMALSLFVAGRFGFTDIIGLKRIFEMIVFIPVGLLAAMFICMVPNIWMQPFFLLPVAYGFFQLIMNPDPFFLADITVGILFSGSILILGASFADRLLRYTIALATFFAILGIIEFIILLLDPSLVSKILLFYDHYSGSLYPVIDHPMQLLGLADGTSYHLFGYSVTRLRSFASEPSLLVGYFLVPGGLALTYSDLKYKWCGLTCIFFCILSLAGSVYTAIACALASSFLTLVKRRHLATILPFILLMVFIWVLYAHFSDLILMAKKSGNDYDFLDKTNSANMRFGYIRDFIPKVLSSPFGLSEDIEQPLGFLLGSAARAGIVGFLIAIMLLLKLYRVIDQLMVSRHLTLTQQIGILVVYGSLTMGVIYLDNCFIQIYGFTLMVLIYSRLVSIRGTLDNRYDQR